MILYKMKEKPTKAGMAQLHFGQQGLLGQLLLPPSISRSGNHIVLSDNPGLDFYPLKDGEQFLADEYDHGVWFGGTDERPFLVRIESSLLSDYKHGGEEAFFESLKPERIRQVEQDEGIATKRQGDIFAVTLTVTWSALLQVMRVTDRFAPRPLSVKQESLFRTRHLLTGLQLVHILSNGNHRDPIVFADGIIRAPDHKPLELNGVHLLAQARGLFDSWHRPQMID